jgi:hypothetical protein
MPTTTFRRDARGGLVNAGEEFKSINPTLLQRNYPRRPIGFTGDLPAMYVGSLNETDVHDSGTRSRDIEAQTVLVFKPTGSEDEISDEQDTLVDYWVDFLTTHPRAAGSNYLIEPRTVRDIELEIDEVPYPASVVTVLCRALEGRSRTGA